MVVKGNFPVILTQFRERRFTMLKKIVCLLLAVIMVLSMVACGKEEKEETKEYDGNALMQALLAQVKFDDAMSSVGDFATLYFPEVPDSATISMYTGSGYYADEVVLITMQSAEDLETIMASVEKHLEQMTAQFKNYIPEEVAKIDNAVIWQGGSHVIVCISNDYATAQKILDNADDPSYQASSGGNVEAPAEEQGADEQAQQDAPQQATEAPPVIANFPVINSQSGTFHDYGNNMIRVDNAAYELCGYDDNTYSVYASLVNSVAQELAGQTTVYALTIPTGYGVKLPNDIQGKLASYTNQGESIEKLFAKLDSSIVPVRCFDNLMAHRDEYLYFRTDHHWNGIGAYYAYEAFCEAKGVQPYTMEQRKLLTFDGFLGTLYANSSYDDNLLPADTVYAYKPYSDSTAMTFYDNNGNGTAWQIVMDVTGWSAGTLYNTFAAGDNPISVLTNSAVTDGSVCVVVKESYGNALMPYLIDHYSTIYEIDYRYWNGNIVEFAKEKGADDMIFANNVMMISADLLVAMLADNVK